MLLARPSGFVPCRHVVEQAMSRRGLEWPSLRSYNRVNAIHVAFVLSPALHVRFPSHQSRPQGSRIDLAIVRCFCARAVRQCRSSACTADGVYGLTCDWSTLPCYALPPLNAKATAANRTRPTMVGLRFNLLTVSPINSSLGAGTQLLGSFD